MGWSLRSAFFLYICYMKYDLSKHTIYQEFEHKHKNAILTYIQIAYDQFSELYDIPDIFERLVKAAKLAELDPTKKWVIEITNYKNKEVNLLIDYFLSRVQNNNEHEQLITNQTLFWRYQAKLRDFDTSLKEASILSAECEKLAERIRHSYTEIYGDANDLKNKKQKVIRLVPESMADYYSGLINV